MEYVKIALSELRSQCYSFLITFRYRYGFYKQWLR